MTAIAAGIDAGLTRGAVSVGAGFPYTPAAARDELLEVFRVAGRHAAAVHVHIGRGTAGLEEVLALAAEGRLALYSMPAACSTSLRIAIRRGRRLASTTWW